jgi:hypothetical protein
MGSFAAIAYLNGTDKIVLFLAAIVGLIIMAAQSQQLRPGKMLLSERDH